MICVIFRVDGVLCGPGSGLLSLLGLGGRRPWGYPGGGRRRARRRRPRRTSCPLRMRTSRGAELFHVAVSCWRLLDGARLWENPGGLAAVRL